MAVTEQILNWVYDQVAQRLKVDATLSSGKVTETILWDAYAKRNIITDTSGVVVVEGQKTKRIWLFSSLDQAVTIGTEISKDSGGTWIQAGGSKSIAANTGFAIFTEADATLVGLGSIKGLLRISLGATVAATAGSIIVVVQTMPF